MASNDKTISVLNKLIETCKDGEYGFRTSAEHLKAASTRQLFLQRADDCRHAASALQREVVALGGNAEEGGSAAGAVHRGWVAVKGTLSGYDDAAILNETERGEDRALAVYKDALKADLPPHVRALVQQQCEGTQRNHDQVRALRDAARSHA